MVTMRATVLRVDNGQLLVLDHSSSQQVIVHTPSACRFCVGDRVCIRFSGAMTMSMPPQITAIAIFRTPRFGPMRGMC